MVNGAARGNPFILRIPERLSEREYNVSQFRKASIESISLLFILPSSFLSALQSGGGSSLGETLGTSVDLVGTQLFLDSEKLVVLGNSFGSTRSAGLDETGLEGDSQVSDVDGLGFTGSVRGHDSPVTGLSELDAEWQKGKSIQSGYYESRIRLLYETHAWMDSEIVPIWLIFNKRPLQAFFSMAVLIRKGLVTVKSARNAKSAFSKKTWQGG